MDDTNTIVDYNEIKFIVNIIKKNNINSNQDAEVRFSALLDIERKLKDYLDEGNDDFLGLEIGIRNQKARIRNQFPDLDFDNIKPKALELKEDKATITFNVVIESFEGIDLEERFNKQKGNLSIAFGKSIGAILAEEGVVQINGVKKSDNTSE